MNLSDQVILSMAIFSLSLSLAVLALVIIVIRKRL